LFLFFKFTFNEFENFMWKKLLIITLKSSVIINQIVFCKYILQIKNLVLKLGYPTFLKLDFISFFDSFNMLYNNSFFIYNFILAEISKFFELKGIYLAIRKSKICISKKHAFNFFLWVIKWDNLNNPLILRFHKNKFFLKKNLKQFFFRNFSACSYKLVVILNRIFKYLYGIFKLNSFYNNFKYLDNYLFKLCWKWAFKKHNKWTSQVILNFYFKYNNKFLTFKSKFSGIRYFKSEKLKLEKKCIHIIRFQSLTLLN
jgi:hypothetical protein